MKKSILFSIIALISIFAIPTVSFSQAHSVKIDPAQDPDSLYVMLTDTVYSKYRHGKGKYFPTQQATALKTFDGCKTYTAVLTQATTAAPTATILRNTLGGTVALTRDSLGVYKGELDDTFTANKSWIQASVGNATGLVAHSYIQTDSTFIIKIWDAAGAAVDLGGNLYLKAEVHP